MEFEEQFPSLKGNHARPLKWIYYKSRTPREFKSILTGETRFDMPPFGSCDKKECDVYPEIIIQKYCKDNQRIREAIDKITTNIDNSKLSNNIKEFLFMELNLE